MTHLPSYECSLFLKDLISDFYYPLETVENGCDTPSGSVCVVVANEPCPSALDFIKGVYILLGVGIPGSGCVVKSWLDHGTVGGRSNLCVAIFKIAP